MFAALIVLHILVALVLVLVILLQSGKAGDLAAAFGGVSSQTAFGVKSAATLLTKITAVAAVIFVLTSMSLAIFYSRGSESTVMEGVTQEAPAPAAAPVEQPESAPSPAPQPGAEPSGGSVQ